MRNNNNNKKFMTVRNECQDAGYLKYKKAGMLMPIKKNSGLPLPENAIIKKLPSLGDCMATLQSDVSRLNAVDPDFRHYDKSTETLMVKVRSVAMSFEQLIETTAKKEAYRKELTLEVAYQMVLDLRRNVPTIHAGKIISDQYIYKSQDQIDRAYNEMANDYSMRPDETVVFRNLWVYTAVALRRCAIQPYRHALGRQVFDLRIRGEIDDNDAYYLARVLDSKTATSQPRYHTSASCVHALQSEFRSILDATDKVIMAMRKYRSEPSLQTIESRDKLVALFKIIADRLRALEGMTKKVFAARPPIPWNATEVAEIDTRDTRYRK